MCRRPAERSACISWRISAHSLCWATDNFGVLQLSRGCRVRRKAVPESSVAMLTVEVAERSFHSHSHQTHPTPEFQPIPCHCQDEETFLVLLLFPSPWLLPVPALLCRLRAGVLLMRGLQNACPSSPFSSTQARFFFFLSHLWWRNSPFCYLKLQVILL